MKRYELIDHTADIGLRIFGGSLPDLFVNAGYALFDVITDINLVNCRHQKRFQLERDSIEELMVEWMSSLLYVFDTELLLFRNFNIISIDDSRLISEAEGEYFNKSIHSIKTEIKAVTYHDLKIYERKGGWEATVILDV
jgi:SHS2 domain-containing protein